MAAACSCEQDHLNTRLYYRDAESVCRLVRQKTQKTLKYDNLMKIHKIGKFEILLLELRINIPTFWTVNIIMFANNDDYPSVVGVCCKSVSRFKFTETEIRQGNGSSRKHSVHSSFHSFITIFFSFWDCFFLLRFSMKNLCLPNPASLSNTAHQMIRACFFLLFLSTL